MTEKKPFRKKNLRFNILKYQMKKIRLSIVKTRSEYRAVIQIGENGENPYVTNRRVVYQSSREIENSRIDARTISRELKEEAKEWTREHKIPYVINIDFDPYE